MSRKFASEAGSGSAPIGTPPIEDSLSALKQIARNPAGSRFDAGSHESTLLNVNRCRRRNVFGSNTATPIAAFTECKTDRSGRCRQPNAYAR
jgi:hypothetical protein